MSAPSLKADFDALRDLVSFAYQHGYHELGHDIVGDLEQQVNRVNSLAVHFNCGGKDPDEKCYSKRDVEALLAVIRACDDKVHRA